MRKKQVRILELRRTWDPKGNFYFINEHVYFTITILPFSHLGDYFPVLGKEAQGTGFCETFIFQASTATCAAKGKKKIKIPNLTLVTNSNQGASQSREEIREQNM